MKKLLFVTMLMFSGSVFAGETSSIRTSSGDLVRVGDTDESLLQKMGDAKPRFYVYTDKKGYSCAATERKYDISLQTYTVISCRGQIIKIEWKNR